MQLVHVYVNFPGNAKEALHFYEGVFGKPIVMMQTFGETSFIKDIPESAKDKLMHGQVPITDAVHLMASDELEGHGKPFVRGNDFHISIVANDKAEADRVFTTLSSTGGEVVMPIGNAPWGPYFGMCIDRFGVQWMVSLPTPA